MKIYLDSVIIIYLLDTRSDFYPQTRLRIAQIKSLGHKLMTSVVALAEVLASPEVDIQLFESFLMRENIQLEVVDAEVCILWAKLRQKTKRSIQPMDMLHLAAAIANNADVFLTNDYHLGKTELGEIKVEMLAEQTA
jgi:predicted nucleic acid-binding protein